MMELRSLYLFMPQFVALPNRADCAVSLEAIPRGSEVFWFSCCLFALWFLCWPKRKRLHFQQRHDVTGVAERGGRHSCKPLPLDDSQGRHRGTVMLLDSRPRAFTFVDSPKEQRNRCP
jgi:hypothetical protein